jgi:hypothetical protein
MTTTTQVGPQLAPRGHLHEDQIYEEFRGE